MARSVGAASRFQQSSGAQETTEGQPQGKEREYGADEISLSMAQLIGDTLYVRFDGIHQEKLVFRTIRPLKDEQAIEQLLDGIANALAARADDPIIAQAIARANGIAVQNCD